MTRVCFLPLYRINGPSSRYRVFQLLPALRRRHIQFSVLPAPERRLGARLLYMPRLLAAARRHDVLFFQKRTLPNWALKMVLHLNDRIVFDMDDAIYLRRDVDAMLQTAAAVIVGNEFLADYARGHNKNVVVISTVVDTELYQPVSGSRHVGDDRIVLGWIGSNPDRGDLAPLRPVFNWLSKRYKNKVVLRIVSDRPLQMRTSLSMEFVPWTLAGSLPALQQFDIGIMPLADTIWNQGKCGLKLIEYMAVAAAAVASPVGVNRQIVEDGRSGYLATTTAEWQERLAYLIEQDAVRLQMGDLAAQRVEQRYSVTAILPQLIDVLQRAAG